MPRIFSSLIFYILLKPYFIISKECISSNIPKKCGPLEGLGTNSWERFNGSASMDITSEDSNCSYKLKLSFKHDTSLPMPTDPSHCIPGDKLAEADDGIPYLGFRWYYKSLPYNIKKATKLDHISIDFSPCGHPPVGIFTTSHYDIHFYAVSPEFRTCMTCNKIPGTPACDPGNQTEENGRAFFSTTTLQPLGKLIDMPKGFQYHTTSSIPYMGSHSWDFSKQPNTTNDWTEPVWVMGTYNRDIINYEPMFPLSYVTGNETKIYTEDLSYVQQTNNQLPTKYTVSYDPITQTSMVIVEGKSAVCGGAYKNLGTKMPDPCPTVKSSSMKSSFKGLPILLGSFLLLLFT